MNNKVMYRCIGAFVALVFAFPAMAGTNAKRATKPSVMPKKPKAKSIDFEEGDELLGEFITPTRDDMAVLTNHKRTSLITLRLSFVPEILKSAEDL